MSYNPNPAAIAQQQDGRFVSFLAQRDVSLQIPVNYVTYPGVVLTAACFANARLEADVYWDVSRSLWSLCPVELGNADGPLTTSVSEASTPFQTATQLASDLLSEAQARDAVTARDVFERQGSEALTMPTFSSSASTPSITTTRTLNANPLIPTSLSSYSQAPPPVPNDVTLIEAGPYSCTLGADLSLLVRVLSAHLESTETNLNATTNVLTLNIHAAAPASDPGGSAQAPSEDDLPDAGSLLSSVIASNASVYLYTPDQLYSQRSNLNASRGWFAGYQSNMPDPSFFEIDDDNGRVYTPNGWPSEGYMEMQNAKRLIVGFGEIDPQMSAYNFTGDENMIFSQNYIEQARMVTFASNNTVDEGCFFEPNVTDVGSVNSSWAITTLGNGTAPIGNGLASILLQARNLTYCGISAVINATLNNATADESYEAYAAFVESTIWSWAPGQPVNSSSSEEFSNYRCAALNATSGYWQASDCSGSHYAACRVNDDPYNWQISDADAPYGRVPLACEGNNSFDVPRTSLEHSYLLSAWRTYRDESDGDDAGTLLWMDFNDLDVESCWVIGQNTSCPYDDQNDVTDTREVAVPVVGGVIVLVLAVLTVLIKCAGNRQTSKRRRKRMLGGIDYEGVPS